MSDTPAADALADKQGSMEESPAVTEIPEAKPIAPEEVDEVKEEKDALEDRPSFSMKPTIIIIASAILGFIIGIALSNGRGSDTAISWVKLPGDLFIRALKCIVLPLVFVNIILAVVDMVKAGKASAVGWKTIGLYLLTTLLAALTGLIFILMFKSGFKFGDFGEPATLPEISITCPDGLGVLGYVNETGSEAIELACFTDEFMEQNNETVFVTAFDLENTNDFLLTTATKAVADDISFSQTLQDGIFRKMIPDNIVGEFISANFVGVIVFAIVFAASSQSLAKQPTVVIELLEEMNRIFLLAIEWIIFLTPIAIISLIAGNLGSQTNLSEVFSNIGLLMGATLLAMAFHFLVTYPILFLAFVRKNPFSYYRFLIPAQLFAFASASSAATLPISLECVKASGEVPDSVRNFVLSMGATLNMDGGAIYFPTAIVFLAISSGLEARLDAAAYFLIVLLSTIGSAGTAPVPSASLVLIITAYNTVFDTSGTPEAFGLILAVDWLMDRFRTTLNVTGDTVMSRIVTAVANVPMHEEEEL